MSKALRIGDTAPAEERWEFRIGAPVEAVDGPFGTLRQVVIDPDDERIEGLIIRADSLVPTNVLVPLDAVLHASEDVVRIAWSAEETHTLGRFDEAAFHVPTRSIRGFAPEDARIKSRVDTVPANTPTPPSRQNLPPIRVGFHVSALDGVAGRVQEVLVDSATGKVTHVIVRQGMVWKHDRCIPVDWVQSVTSEGLTLGITLADLERLPEYHTDEELREAILEAWQQDDGLRPLLSRTFLQLSVRDGRATVRGYVWTHVHRQRLEELARSVPGVLDLRNEVVSDDEIPLKVMEALGSDPRTRDLPVYVSCSFGEVRLEGSVPNETLRDAVSEVAATVPRIRAVDNRMLLPGQEEEERSRPNSLLPHVGQPVLTHDGPFGHVARVLLDPRTRLVNGIIVEGDLPMPERIDPTTHPEDWPREPRAVVIPAEWIEVVANEILLHTGLRQAASARDYRPGDFEPAKPEWLPPFPYEREEVLLAVSEPGRADERAVAVSTAPVMPPEGSAAGVTPGDWPISTPVLQQGHYVCCADGPIGVIDHLLVDPRTNEAEYLAVRGEENAVDLSLVPARWIREVDKDTVRLQCSRTDLSAIKRYRTPAHDAEIAASVRDALAGFLRGPSPLPPVLIRVEQGVVHLSGPVTSEIERETLVEAAGAQPGVRAVHDELTTTRNPEPSNELDAFEADDETQEPEPRARRY